MNPSCAPLYIFRFLLGRCLNHYSDGGLLVVDGVGLPNILNIHVAFILKYVGFVNLKKCNEQNVLSFFFFSLKKVSLLSKPN